MEAILLIRTASCNLFTVLVNTCSEVLILESLRARCIASFASHVFSRLRSSQFPASHVFPCGWNLDASYGCSVADLAQFFFGDELAADSTEKYRTPAHFLAP